MLLQNEHSRLKTSPVPVQRTSRRHDLRVLTSLPAGKMVPLAAIPLLREDAITRGQATVTFEMMETAEILLNAVNVRVMAYLVPFLAFERFVSMDDINRSYEGIARGAESVIPFFETMVAPAHGTNEILTYMGKHFKAGTTINTAYVEAYNEVWNFRARNRSLNIAPRARLATTLAPAFWQHNQFSHIVPDFDQAIVDGEVALSITPGSTYTAPVKGIAIANSQAYTGTPTNFRENGTVGDPAGTNWVSPVSSNVAFRGDNTTKIPDIKADLTAVFAELTANGITVSLSNIEMARKTQAFANLRRQYHGHSDEWLIDLLMDGIQVPDQAWKQPMLLSDQSTVFGMAKRYASDAANLTESAVNGATAVNVSWAVPRLTTGGVVMLVAEITPEQLFERQRDTFLHTTTVAALPQFLRDTLDPEPVSVVQNGYVDTDHATPTGTFGYAPLNYEWANNPPQIGGRFYRPAVNSAFDEARQRIWAVETANPVLSQDFYLCTTMHQKPFLVTNIDPFEAVVRGAALIQGNTVFGPGLIEANNDYSEVVEEQPRTRITGVAE